MELRGYFDQEVLNSVVVEHDADTCGSFAAVNMQEATSCRNTDHNLDRGPLSRPPVKGLNGQAGRHVFGGPSSAGHSVLRAAAVSLIGIPGIRIQEVMEPVSFPQVHLEDLDPEPTS